MIAELPALTADGGTVLLFAGMPEGARVSVDAFALHYREVSITGSFHYTPRDVDTALVAERARRRRRVGGDRRADDDAGGEDEARRGRHFKGTRTPREKMLAWNPESAR